jgi:hypothetical protein
MTREAGLSFGRGRRLRRSPGNQVIQPIQTWFPFPQVELKIVDRSTRHKKPGGASPFGGSPPLPFRDLASYWGATGHWGIGPL